MSNETANQIPPDLAGYVQNVRPHPMGVGVQHLYKFPNGYGASVVCTPYTYGGDTGLWELAVLDKDGHLDYTTPITSDVVGYQTWAQILDLLRAIAALPAEAQP